MARQIITAGPPEKTWQIMVNDILEQAQTHLHSENKETGHARTYLMHQRGLTPETMRHFKLGYLSRPVIRHIEGERIVIPPGILIPRFYQDNLYAVNVRRITGKLAETVQREDDPYAANMGKYSQVKGSRPNQAIFNGDAIRPGCDLVIVEGEFDAMLGQQILGSQMTFITMGTATGNFQQHKPAIQQAGSLRIMMDTDASGKAAAQKVAAFFRPHFHDHLHIIDRPAHYGKDLTDYVMLHDGDLHRLLTGQSRALWTPRRMPDNIRIALINYVGHGITQFIDEGFNPATVRGYINPDNLTMNGIINACKMVGCDMRPSTIRALFNKNTVPNAAQLFFLEISTCIDSLNTIDSIENTYGGNSQKKRKGRPAKHYRLRERDDIVDQIMPWVLPRLVEWAFPVKTEKEEIPLPCIIIDSMLQAVGYDERQADELALRLEGVMLDTLDQRIYIEIKARYDRACYDTYEELHQLFTRTLRGNHQEHGSLLPGSAPYHHRLAAALNDPEEHTSLQNIAIRAGVSKRHAKDIMLSMGLEPRRPDGEKLPITIEQAPVENSIERYERELHGRAVSLDIVYDYDRRPSSRRFPMTTAAQHKLVCEKADQALEEDVGRVSVVVQRAHRWATAEHWDEHGRDDDGGKFDSRASRVSRDAVPYVPTTSHRGPGYDPKWVRDHLILWLCWLYPKQYTMREHITQKGERNVKQMTPFHIPSGQFRPDLEAREIIDLLLSEAAMD